MLTDWYFCCCIKASPTSTKTFLTILETLENTESDGQILYLAYDELRRTDIWMQVYALPQVLKSLKRIDLPQAIEEVIIKPYFYDLIENLPEELYEKYQKLINVVLDGAELKFIIQALIETIQATPRKNSSEIRTPYLDLKEFLLETLILAILANQLEYHIDFANALEAEIGNDTSEIKSLLEDSLDYKYGRLAFRLAVQIYQLTALEAPDELLSLIKETPFSEIELEPDLLRSFASVWSREILSELNQDSQQAVQKIINESLELTELRRLITKRKQKNTKDPDLEEFYVPLRRIGIEPNQYLVKNLPIIYWQSILWEVASQLDAIAVAEELGKFWLPPQEAPENLEIWRSYKNVAEDWKGQLKFLLSVRGERVSISANQGYDLPLEDEHKWLFVSPWIRIKRSAHNKRRYPTAEKSENLIRLIVALYVSIRLLQTPDNLYSQEFSKLIAHASDVIEKTYNKFLNTYNYESN
ncbi:MAG: hypothetical protein SAK29_40350, partial [Scytonema sp. PMC 1069.18]|nr:hypothetical protein [Scytonema sp. PMC 1069.18]